MALVALLALSATPAAAATKTRENEKTFPTPNQGTFVTVTLIVTTSTDGRNVAAGATVSWVQSIYPVVDAWDQFEFNVRLEHNDTVIATKGCYPVAKMNAEGRGSVQCPYTGWVPKTGSNTWTADATVRYDINLDGEGDFLWPLTGTGAV